MTRFVLKQPSLFDSVVAWLGQYCPSAQLQVQDGLMTIMFGEMSEAVQFAMRWL